MLNKVMIIGNLGKDPETKNINGNTVCNFTVATSERWTDKQGQKQERTEWHRISTWGKLAENCGKYLAKGRKVYVEGKLQTRQWEKDGQKHYTTEISANVVNFLTPAGEGTAPNRGNSAPGDFGSEPDFGQDEIPF